MLCKPWPIQLTASLFFSLSSSITCSAYRVMPFQAKSCFVMLQRMGIHKEKYRTWQGCYQYLPSAWILLASPSTMRYSCYICHTSSPAIPAVIIRPRVYHVITGLIILSAARPPCVVSFHYQPSTLPRLGKPQPRLEEVVSLYTHIRDCTLSALRRACLLFAEVYPKDFSPHLTVHRHSYVILYSTSMTPSLTHLAQTANTTKGVICSILGPLKQIPVPVS